MSFSPRTAIGITLFLLFAAIALSDSRDLRFILLAPAAVLFTFHTALYGLEYDYLARQSRKPSQTIESAPSLEAQAPSATKSAKATVKLALLSAPPYFSEIAGLAELI